MIIEWEKANSKLCPMTMNNLTECCQGEKCMAWRWLGHEEKGWGYCGLAGKPEVDWPDVEKIEKMMKGKE